MVTVKRSGCQIGARWMFWVLSIEELSSGDEKSGATQVELLEASKAEALNRAVAERA